VDIAVVTIDKFKVDDPVGAVAVHGVNGTFGTLTVGLFAEESGLFTTGQIYQLGVQAIGVFTIAAFSFTVTYLVFKVLDKTIGIRITAIEEEIGIDKAEYGIDAYDDYM